MVIRSAISEDHAIRYFILLPRKITLVLLFLFGAALEYCAWKFLPQNTLAWASGIAAPFCTMCATLVWASREKIDGLIDPQALNEDEFLKLANLSKRHRSRVFFWAPFILVCALIAGAPAIALQFQVEIFRWLTIIAGGAVGVSLYSYLLTNSWDEQIRKFKTERMLNALRKIQSDALKNELAESEEVDRLTLSLVGRGWKEHGRTP